MFFDYFIVATSHAPGLRCLAYFSLAARSRIVSAKLTKSLLSGAIFHILFKSNFGFSNLPFQISQADHIQFICQIVGIICRSFDLATDSVALFSCVHLFSSFFGAHDTAFIADDFLVSFFSGSGTSSFCQSATFIPYGSNFLYHSRIEGP